MIKLYTHSHNQSTLAMRSLTIRHVVSQKLNGLMVNSSSIIDGHQLTSYPNRSTGELWTAKTGSHGTRISTFPNIAAHAGLREQQAPLLIDSTLCKRTFMQLLLPSMLKLLSMHMLVEAATVVTPPRFTSGPTTTVSLIALASNTLLTIFKLLCSQSMNAETAPGHHHQLVTLVLMAAGLSLTENTM